MKPMHFLRKIHYRLFGFLLVLLQLGFAQEVSFRILPLRPVEELRADALKAQPPPEPGTFLKPDLVELVKLDPTIKLDIRYAVSNTFLGTPVYTQARLHYHFPTKAELGRALIERYRTVFGAALEAIDQSDVTPRGKLQQYVGLYDSVLSDERMCLCGMLAAEYATLPRPMQQGLRLFFSANERWLTAVLKDGLRTGTFLFGEPANERARFLIGALEGAML